MKKPLIGVLPLYDTVKESYWMLPGYLKGIEEAGGIPVMLPLSTDPDVIKTIANTFDGFLFTGGMILTLNYTVRRLRMRVESCAMRGIGWSHCFLDK